MSLVYILISLIDNKSEKNCTITMNIHLSIDSETFFQNKKNVFDRLTRIVNETNNHNFKIDYMKKLKEMPNDTILTIEKFEECANNLIGSSVWRSFWTYKYHSQ